MGCEWKEVSVSELGSIITGKTPKTSVSDNYGGEYLFLTPSDDMEAKYVYSTNRTLSELGKHEVRKIVLPVGSICVSCIGSDLGKVVITTRETVTNQQINSIVLDKKLYDTDFVYYAMLILGKQLNHISKTSTAVPIVNKTSFSNYTILVPELPTQQKIAKILSSLDDKIELNNRMNENLEAQAQAIFKSWFVDFEPFGGGMPEGWREGILSELIDIKYGKDHKLLADGNIPVYGSGGLMRKAEKSLYCGESVLIPRKGTLNNVLYVNEEFWTVDTMFYSIMKHANTAKYVHQMMIRKDLAAMNAGSAVPSMTAKLLNEMMAIVPDANTLKRYESAVGKTYLAIQSNQQENQRLAQLRDTLLPRLMSGEIDVDGV